MRFVDASGVYSLLGELWHKNAKAARSDARDAADANARKKIIDNKASLWSDAGRVLATLTATRCWYCEVRETRSDMPVDHFRPKNRVAEERVSITDPITNKSTWEYTHDGYWWLAFKHTNYRYCCTFCNSRRVDDEGCTDGGKQDHFPLLPGSTRARCETDDHDLEIPVLLDPCVPSDPELLTFRQDGLPVPRRTKSEDPVANERAVKSIRLYHLDHANLVAERRKLWAKVDGLVDRGTRNIKLHGVHDPSVRDVKEDLHALIRRSSPLCRLAHLALRARRDIQWVREWLEDIETTL